MNQNNKMSSIIKTNTTTRRRTTPGSTTKIKRRTKTGTTAARTITTTPTTITTSSSHHHHRRSRRRTPRPLLQNLLPALHHLLLLLLLTLIDVARSCPADVCICKWKGGKQTVECGGQQLPTIPEGMDPGTQVLNFSGNSLQVLQSERFLRMDLLNLQKIYLSRNQLIRIHEKAFRGLTNLVELDLSDNSLQHVPTETFQDYTSLMRLSLSGNPIRELKTSAFRYLSFLTTLELSNCQIERIENEAFVGMDNLEWLRLDGNRIGFIQGARILPKSLHGISLQSNRWTCDCRLLDIHAWLVNYNTPQTEEPKCVEPPRLKGQLIKTLRREELACLPEVTPKSTYTEISEGRNVSIMCVVRAIPEPKVLWLFNGQVMTNDSLVDNLHMSYYIDESVGSGSEEKRSEIFIYNVGSEDNGTFSCVGQNIAGTTFSNYTLRVIVKEPPVVNEVSFPRDYMNYIIASSTGAGVIFAVLLCTVVVKCKQRKPSSAASAAAAKRKKALTAGGAVSGEGGIGIGGSIDGTMTTGTTTTSNGNDLSLGLGPNSMKCSSIMSDGDSLGGVLGDSLTPTKGGVAKENGGGGGVIIGGQMKQNLMMYAPAHFQQQHLHLDSASQSMQLHSGSPTPPPPSALMMGVGYCSPPSSMRNYHQQQQQQHQQEKNPDLVNDAESGNNKNKMKASCDASDYDASSDCSGPCSIQGMPTLQSLQSQSAYDNNNCYQLSTAQFGAQMMRPGGGVGVGNANPAASRFAAMTTLPRGLQLKSVMNNMAANGGVGVNVGVGVGGGQHQVDVHLNPVCFLGQDGFAYDYSTAHMHAALPLSTSQQASTHSHLHLQQQHSLGASPQQQQQQQQQQHHQQQQQQQQNFYRTLPHNRAHKQQQFAANPGLRYSLEAEFLQRGVNVGGAATPPTYDKYLGPSVRFTAEGYPVHTMIGGGGGSVGVAGGLVQYPSPPEGYKSNSATPPPPQLTAQMSLPETSSSPSVPTSVAGFQQWPPCLPGYHAQPIRYPPTIVGVLSNQGASNNHNNNVGNGGSQQHPPATHTSQSQTHTSQSQTHTQAVSSCHTQTPASNNNNNNNNINGSGPSSSSSSLDMKKRCVAAQADDSTIPECDENDVAAAAATAASTSVGQQQQQHQTLPPPPHEGEESTKLRHLTGPLADSPDEGYVGDSQEGSTGSDI